MSRRGAVVLPRMRQCIADHEHVDFSYPVSRREHDGRERGKVRGDRAGSSTNGVELAAACYFQARLPSHCSSAVL